MDALDVPEPQILVHFPGDTAMLVRHQRLLLKNIGRLELCVHSLSEDRHLVLERAAMSPSQHGDAIYGFDMDLTRAQTASLQRRAAMQAAILDDRDAEPVEQEMWIVSEADLNSHGDEKGVVIIDGAEVYAQNVTRSGADALVVPTPTSSGRSFDRRHGAVPRGRRPALRVDAARVEGAGPEGRSGVAPLRSRRTRRLAALPLRVGAAQPRLRRHRGGAYSLCGI